LKTAYIRFIVIVGILGFIIGCGGQTAELPIATAPVPEPEKPKGWNETFDKAPLPGYIFVYAHTTRNWYGRVSAVRRQIPSEALWEEPASGTAGSQDIFSILHLMGNPDRVREVKKNADGSRTLTIERGLKLSLDGKSVEMDAVATCQFQETKPLRFTFDAIPPEATGTRRTGRAQPTVRKLQVVYEWGNYRGGEERLWVPVKIVWDVVLQLRGVDKQVQETWEMREIRPVQTDEMADDDADSISTGFVAD
jgi:hypothetical protein